MSLYYLQCLFSLKSPYIKNKKILSKNYILILAIYDIFIMAFSLEVRSLSDLYKLKPLIEGGTLKINKSQIDRELKVDRRTVGKYINGFCKSKTRNCCNCITNFKSIISCLLDPSSERIFYYKAILYRYLIDNHNYKGSYANFCLYIKSIDEFNNYFKKRRPSNVNNVTLRFETAMGKLAQLDWKEHISFKLK